MTAGELVVTEVLSPEADQTAAALSTYYLRNFPRQAARRLELMAPADGAVILSRQPNEIRLPIWLRITSAAASLMLPYFSDETALEMLSTLDAGPCARLLSRLDESHRNHYLGQMDETVAHEMRELLDYPPDCAGYIMDTRLLGFSAEISVHDAMNQLRRYPASMRRRIYTLDSDGKLRGQVELAQLVGAEPEQTLDEIGSGIDFHVYALDHKEEVAQTLRKNSIEALPVIDVNHHLLGVIRGVNAIETLKEDFAVDIQTMFGASRDEQALSSSFFAVRKRQGWLQINLLTGFLAAAVVGLFESTISQFTALAVLMPIAAGQSGNTGAQALAVTMRGLTLREITTRHWFRVMFKEAGAGLINGLAIALTCSLGVYLWSQNFGLSLVIALAMVISMTIAGIGGALVPICLQKLGQDPAQSSSIILTTVTDIAGFMSFLGIATLLASMLAQA
jgi:magnesium transporter